MLLHYGEKWEGVKEYHKNPDLDKTRVEFKKDNISKRFDKNDKRGVTIIY